MILWSTATLVLSFLCSIFKILSVSVFQCEKFKYDVNLICCVAFHENSYFWDFSFQTVVCDETETYSTDMSAILGNIVDLDRRDKAQ